MHALVAVNFINDSPLLRVKKMRILTVCSGLALLPRSMTEEHLISHSEAWLSSSPERMGKKSTSRRNRGGKGDRGRGSKRTGRKQPGGK